MRDRLQPVPHPAAPAPQGRPRYRLRWRPWLTVTILLVFHALPWLRWNGRQALLFDLPARRFDLFGLTLWPHDFGLWLCLLGALGAGLVLLTNLAGRVWCGYGCPQTVWSRLFRWIESSSANLPGPAWLGAAVKQVAWAALALWTALTLVGYFSPIRELFASGPPAWSGWQTFWIVFYTLATWGNAGFLREQVCRDLCPYARLHALCCDVATPRMHYDARRGEPRGARAPGLGSVLQRGRGLLDPTSARDYAFRAAHARIAGPMPAFAADRLGDCVDCAACVAACPMALDVRAGADVQCISCGACMEACDAQMRTAGFPAGLIRYASDNQMQRRRGRKPRPRMLAAAGVLLGLLTVARYGF